MYCPYIFTYFLSESDASLRFDKKFNDAVRSLYIFKS